MKKYGLIIGLFLVASVLVYLFSSSDDYVKTGKFYINEILPSNSYTYSDSDGEYSDYIELYNGNNYDLNLSGYHLTDSMFELNKWTFPDIEIKAKSYLLIYATGKNKCDDVDNCHTNFRLKKDGETVSLIDKTGNIISRVSFKEVSNDEAISYVKGKYQITIPTPKKENSTEVIKKIDTSNYKLKINEYLSHNKGINYTTNGGYYDWVEIYNEGEEVSLKGISISDDESDLGKFNLPDVKIKKDEYLVIYLTGGEQVEDKICANFKLSDNDKKIVLSGNNKIIDMVDVIKLDQNISYGRSGDKWLYYLSPTPGKANTTHGVERIGT